MSFCKSTALAVLGLSMALAASGSAKAADRRPVVVELFNSQGCSSWPPANANLIELMQRPDVLTLSFAVTYWDRLDWKDIFGKKEFTDRQIAYEAGLGEGAPFTPQIVVEGRNTIVGNRLNEIEGLIDAQKLEVGPAVQLGRCLFAHSGGVKVGSARSNSLRPF